MAPTTPPTPTKGPTQQHTIRTHTHKQHTIRTHTHKQTRAHKVLTGSQMPLSSARTDARQNLVDALTCAVAAHAPPHVPFQEVAVCFGGKLMRGNRSQKGGRAPPHACVSAAACWCVCASRCRPLRARNERHPANAGARAHIHVHTCITPPPPHTQHTCAVDSSSYAAFDSPSYPPLATLGIGVDWAPKLLLQPEGSYRPR